jgi:hypothetical protein
MKLDHAEIKRLTALARKAAARQAERTNLLLSIPEFSNVQLLQGGGAIVEAMLQLSQEDLEDAARTH